MSAGDVPPHVCAIVVTHERLPLLQECLAAIAAQTRRPDGVLVVDNASTDGTPEAIASDHRDVELLVMDRNGGGAGGFAAGLRHAYRAGFGWFWLMDDDTVPERDALDALVRADASVEGRSRPLVLASAVQWRDRGLHPMNVPAVRVADAESMIHAARDALLPIRSASFVSVLVHRVALERYGLPRAEYFIYNDDVEFTGRVLRHETGYLVPASVVHHRTPTAYQPYELDSERFFYDVRNTLLMLRGDAWTAPERARHVRDLAHNVRQHLARNRLRRPAITAVARGLLKGLRESIAPPEYP